MRLFLVAFLSLAVSSTVGFQPNAATKIGGLARVNFGKVIKKGTPTFSGVSKPQNNDFILHAAASAPESGEWTKSRIHNKSWFRSVALMFALGLVAGTQQSPLSQLPAKFGAAIHLLAFGTWFGTAVYTTFVLGLTMFKNLPRQTFGKLQAKLFPKYFSLCSSMILLQFFTFRSLPLGITKNVIWSLGGALSATLFNQIFLEPYSTKIMLERYELENSEGGQDTDRYKVLKSTFGKMHGISSLSNLIALCGGVAYGFILSSLLVVV